MKKIGFMIFALALAVGLVVANMFSCGSSAGKLFTFSVGSVAGSGNIISDARSLSEFTAVDVGGVFEVEITAQKEFMVEIEGDDNLLPLVKTEVRDGILKIESDGKFSPTSRIRIRISAPDIKNLDVSGASTVSLGNIKNTRLKIEASGASKITLSGETDNLSIDVSGATKVNADELKSIDAEIEASGASRVNVSVSGKLKADANGASKIIYSGSPSQVEKSSRGASRVSEK